MKLDMKMEGFQIERKLSKTGREDIKFGNPLFISDTIIRNEDWSIVIYLKEDNYDSDPLTGYKAFRTAMLYDFYDCLVDNRRLDFIRLLFKLRDNYENFDVDSTIYKKLITSLFKR